ncbi:NLRC3, partial [Symbiodinium sp. CCMP2456]
RFGWRLRKSSRRSLRRRKIFAGRSNSSASRSRATSRVCLRASRPWRCDRRPAESASTAQARTPFGKWPRMASRTPTSTATFRTSPTTLPHPLPPRSK